MPNPPAGDETYTLASARRLDVRIDTADYATLEYRPSTERFVVRMMVEEIPADEAGIAAQQINDLGDLGARINRGGTGL